MDNLKTKNTKIHDDMRKIILSSQNAAIRSVEFTEGGGASKCPDASKMLSGYFRNWCPDVSEMLSGYFRNWCPDVSEMLSGCCLITEQTANAMRPQLSEMRLGLTKGGGADE